MKFLLYLENKFILKGPTIGIPKLLFFSGYICPMDLTKAVSRIEINPRTGNSYVSAVGDSQVSWDEKF